jgi:hypothetical protein
MKAVGRVSVEEERDKASLCMALYRFASLFASLCIALHRFASLCIFGFASFHITFHRFV